MAKRKWRSEKHKNNEEVEKGIALPLFLSTLCVSCEEVEMVGGTIYIWGIKMGSPNLFRFYYFRKDLQGPLDPGIKVFGDVLDCPFMIFCDLGVFSFMTWETGCLMT